METKITEAGSLSKNINLHLTSSGLIARLFSEFTISIWTRVLGKISTKLFTY